MDQIRVEAPASSANPQPGLRKRLPHSPWTAPETRSACGSGAATTGALSPSVKMARVTGLDGSPRSEVRKNRRLRRVLWRWSKQLGIRKEIVVETREARVPIGLGMGSSSGALGSGGRCGHGRAARAGADVRRADLLRGEGRRRSRPGSPHYDNVAASILGGIRGREGRCRRERRPAVRFDPPAGLAVCVATPVVSLPGRKTEYALSLLLPESVPLEDAGRERRERRPRWWRSFAKKDIKLIGKGMTNRGRGAGEEVDDPGLRPRQSPEGHGRGRRRASA